MSIREHLETIYNDKGNITPQIVVDEARPKAHPLHHNFEWDNKVAGEEYRLEQARCMIRKIQIITIVGKKTATSRAYHHIPDATPTSDAYLKVADLSPMQRKLLVQQMDRDWKQFKNRYDHLVEFVALMQTHTTAKP